MYYTACLLLTIQWQLLCQAIVSLVYKWEGLVKIVWGGGGGGGEGGLQPPEPPPPPPPRSAHDCSQPVCDKSFPPTWKHVANG